MLGNRVRNQWGVVLPSPVVLLSVVAVAMAAVAFVATRGEEPTEREVTTVSRAEKSPEPSAAPTSAAPTIKPKPVRPAVRRDQVYVEVYNNTGIAGLAGDVATRASDIGWKVVGSDNWIGTIPTTTVYYPAKLQAAAKKLALDLGIQRTVPAIDPMRQDRLTLILTEPLA